MTRKNPRQESLQKIKIFLKVKLGKKYTEYKAVYKKLEIWGKTVGTKENVKDIVRRIISAPNTILDSGVTRAVIGLANYVVSMISINSSSRVVWGVVEVACESGDRLKLGASLYYVTDYDAGKSWWCGEVEAVYYGNDGLIGGAIHKVVRRFKFKEEADIVRLYRELLRVARHAINASSTATRPV